MWVGGKWSWTRRLSSTAYSMGSSLTSGSMNPLTGVVYETPQPWQNRPVLGMKIGNTINDRSLNLDLYQGFEETTVDLYSAVRNGYLQRRENMIKGPPPY